MFELQNNDSLSCGRRSRGSVVWCRSDSMTDAHGDMLMWLRRRNDWFWALEAITGENPVPKADAGNMAESSVAWIEWGKANGHLK